MSAWNHQPSPNLAEWLNTATEKLSAPAQERIKLEISSHFEDALEAKLAEGLSEADAQAKVLADLGDADSAAKRFRKEHLTKSEVKWIKGELGYTGNLPRWLCALFDLGSAAVILIVSFHAFHRHGAAAFGISAAMIYCGLTCSRWLLIISKQPKPWLPAIMWFSILTNCSFMFILGCYFGDSAISGVAMTIPSVAVSNIREIYFLLKLWHIRDVWQEMPPPGDPAS